MLKTETLTLNLRSNRKYLWWDVAITVEIVAYFTLLTVIFILERKIAIMEAKIANHTPRTQPTFTAAPATSLPTLSIQASPEKEVERKSERLPTTPKDSKAQQRLAASYYQQGQVPQAIAHYQKLLDAKPLDAELHLTVGQMYMSMPQFTDNAIRHLQKTLELQPRHPRRKNIEVWVEQLQNKQNLMLQQKQRVLATFKKHLEAKAQPHDKK